ncbi:MAG: hypothetical protein IPG00_22245 [Saprospiraceae bacterium]|nr:hypothetical protein [Saprospiraceae bacterium]
MKKSLTFIFLWLSIILTAQPQTGIIKVNVEDGCGNAFDKPVTIDLYQVIGTNATKITSVTFIQLHLTIWIRDIRMKLGFHHQMYQTLIFPSKMLMQ